MTGPFFPSVDPTTLRLRDQHLPSRLDPANLRETIEDTVGAMFPDATYNDTLGIVTLPTTSSASTAVSSPTELTGLALWLDAADPSSVYTDTAGTTPAVAESAAVAYWADKSGNGRNATQTTAGSRPALNRFTRSGRNALYFDGAGDYFATTLNPSTALTEGLSIFTVAKLDDVASRTWSWLYGDGLSSTTDGLYLGKKQSVDQMTFAATSWHTGGDVGAGAFVGGWHQFGHQESDAVRRVLLDGTALTDAANTNSSMTITQFNVGARPASSEWWKGPIGEMIVYNRVLTTAERQRVESYLRTKWGTP